MKKRIIFILSLVVVLVVGTWFSYFAYLQVRETQRKHIALEKRKAAWETLRIQLVNRINTFSGEAGIVIKDLEMNWEIDFNKDTLIPSASLVKIPIMISLFQAAEEEKISLQDTISLKGSERVEGSKALGDMPTGSVFTVEELITPMITLSDNTAANLLIDYIGFDTLNAYFKKMDLKNTNIARKMMDFRGRGRGVENYTTAADMAMALENLYRCSTLNKDSTKQCLLLLGEQKINDRIPKKLPKDETFIAHKTGLERSVCHDVGIVFTPKGNFLICVLVKHENRFALPAKRFISDIALLTYNYYQSFN